MNSKKVRVGFVHIYNVCCIQVDIKYKKKPLGENHVTISRHIRNGYIFNFDITTLFVFQFELMRTFIS